MSITAWDLKEASFTSDLQEVQELTLTNKGIVDVGDIAQVPQLRSLSLAFNALASLQGLSPLSHLQSLNVSHNQLAQLRGISALTSLATLNASHNKLASLSGVAGCSGLKDLWVQNNAIKGLEDLRALSVLTGLNRLCVAGNPVCKATSAQKVRMAAVHLCPSLQAIDGLEVSKEEREAAATFTLDPPGLAYRALTTSPSASVSPSGSAPGSPLASLNARNGAAVARQRRLSASSQSDASPARHPGGGLPSRSSLSGVKTGGSRSQSESALARQPTDPLPHTGEGGSGLSSVGSLMSLYSTPPYTLKAHSRVPHTSRGTIPSSRHINLEGTNFQAVLDTLPRFDPAKLPPRHDPPRLEHPKLPPKPPPAEGQVIDFECRYPRGSQGRGITVRRDGSAAAYLPNGDLAVTVDADYSTGPEPSHRMFAAFRGTGSVAVSWDHTGGFVQYPTGAIMMMYSRDTGSGTCYTPAGVAYLKWRDSDSSGLPPAVDTMLDSHLGIRYLPAQQQLTLYMSCEGLRYQLLCGKNEQGATWDPPAPSIDPLNPSEAGPAFLRQLAKEGSAAASRAAAAKEKAAASAAGGGEGEAEVASFASLGASLKALDDGLNQWLKSKVRG